MELIFEKSRPGRRASSIPPCDVPPVDIEQAIGRHLLRNDIDLPEVSEGDLIRHYTNLATRNFGLDSGFYPLGSCTMKYNPKINEEIAQLPGFTSIHPYAPVEYCQGSLQLAYELEGYLCEIFGMDAFTLQPAAGAHGELTGIMVMKKYFEKIGETRIHMLIPDTAHGTNPASSALCGLLTRTVRSSKDGGLDVSHLDESMAEDVLGLMLTNPNTLGLFEKDIERIAGIVHDRGGLLYCDGANANAFLGITRPGDLGFDVIQLNLHKTFSTPHGAGGPGSGPVGVRRRLEAFLPVPRIIEKNGIYALTDDCPDSIGQIRAFYGNFNVLVKAYAYIRSLGPEGLKRVAEIAVLNANYIKERLKPYWDLPYDRACMHECVFSAERIQRETGVRAMDIAKRLIDYGFHPPTIAFPLIVREAIMIEPTETESRETIDAFCDAMIRIAREIREDPELVREAPKTTPIGRLDEVSAARKPVVIWQGKESEG